MPELRDHGKVRRGNGAMLVGATRIRWILRDAESSTLTVDAPKKRWRLYATSNGNHVVRDELRALGSVPAGELTDLMKRYARGESLPREEESLPDSGGLRALRVFVGNDPYRLIFASDGRRVYLALRAIYKNQRKLPRNEIRLARQRLDDWRARGAEPPGGR